MKIWTMTLCLILAILAIFYGLLLFTGLANASSQTMEFRVNRRLHCVSCVNWEANR